MLFDPYTYDLTRQTQPPAQPGTAWAASLLAVPMEARALLWRGLTDAVAGAIDLWECTPPGHRGAPLSFPVRHAGQRYFQPADLREQTLAGWHRLTGIELRLAAQAREALIQEESADHRDMLAEQCTRVGQLYSELKRRAGPVVALSLLRGELRMLRYRASPVLAPLIYD